MALEQTYNKEGKTSLFKGITKSGATRDKYIKSLLFLTLMSESVKNMVHMACSQSDHHDKLSKHDIDKVVKIKMTIADKMTDPFSNAAGIDNIVNICTGEVHIFTELLDAKHLGLASMKLASSTGAHKMNIPKITTFALQQKKRKAKAKQCETSEIGRSGCYMSTLLHTVLK